MNRVHVGLSVAGAVAAMMKLAAPATADTAGYLEGLEPVYTSLTRDQLLTAGSVACGVLGSGQPAPVAVNVLNKQMGFSLAAGNSVVSAAVIDLGC